MYSEFILHLVLHLQGLVSDTAKLSKFLKHMIAFYVSKLVRYTTSVLFSLGVIARVALCQTIVRIGIYYNERKRGGKVSKKKKSSENKQGKPKKKKMKKWFLFVFACRYRKLV